MEADSVTASDHGPEAGPTGPPLIELRRVLPDWQLPAHTGWVVFPGRKLMPAKTRVFIDMLQAALDGADFRI